MYNNSIDTGNEALTGVSCLYVEVGAVSRNSAYGVSRGFMVTSSWLRLSAERKHTKS
jgi:hypothetical protein